MAVLREDMSVAIDELESAIAEIESRLETTRAERDEAKGRQVELEIENANLRRELGLARERQNASAQILASIANTGGDAAHALQLIAETAQHFFDASSVTIRITDGKEWIRTIRVGRGSEQVMAAVPAHELAVHGKNVAGLVYRENRQIHVPDIDHVDASIADFPGWAPARSGGSRTVSGTPLRLGTGAIGAMIIHRDRLAAFTNEELALQQSFADQAVIAIENARLFNETQEALEQQRAIASILSAINHAGGDLSPVFDCILENAHRLCDAPCGSLQLYEGDRVVPVAIRGMTPAFTEFLRAGYPITDGIREGLMADHPIQTVDLVEAARNRGDEPLLRAALELGRIRSMITVPLAKDGVTFGRIVAARQEVRPFEDAQTALLQSFAAQAVIAIENARLFNETKEALEQQKASSDILRVISSSVADAHPVFDKILASCKHLFGSDETAVLLLDGEDTIRLGAYVGNQYEAVAATFPAPLEKSPAGRAIREQHVVHYTDVANDPRLTRAVRRVAELAGYESMAYAPMLSNGRGIGAIGVSRNRGTFSDKELMLLQNFADQAVIAIENARLFNETQEALERQTATADVLNVISRSPTDAGPVFDVIGERAEKLCNAEISVISVRDGDLIRIVGIRGISSEGVELFRAHSPMPLDRQTVTARTIKSGAVVQIADVLADTTYDNKGLAARTGYRNCLGVPMHHKGEVVGAIFVARSEPGLFSDHQIRLLEIFADQAVIAIQNVRLFNETQEALERQTATADILKVIASSPSDVQPVFDAIAQSANRLIDGFTTAVHRIIDDNVHLMAFTSRGAEADETFKAMYPRPQSEVPTVALVQNGETAQFPNIEAASEHTRELARLRGWRSSTVTPLMSQGAFIGYIACTRREPGLLADHHVQLLRTFADQAVIAIENARLFNETKEALERQTATADILKVIAASPSDVQPVFDAIAASSKRLLAGFSTTVFRLVDGVLHLVAFTPTNAQADTALTAMFPRPIADFPPFAMISDGRMARIEDTESDAGVPSMLRDLARLRGYRAMLLTPLMREGAVLGMISVTREKPGAWAEHHAGLLRTFADQAVIAIENARLFNEVTARTEELSESLQQQTAVGDVLKTISRSAFDLQPVLDSLVNTAALLCNADMAFIMRREGDEYRAGAAVGYAQAYIDFLTEHPLAVDRGTVTGRAVIERRPVQILDVVADPEYTLHETTSLAGQRTTLGVPLLREDEPVGVIVLARQRVEAFTQKQIDLVTTFADQAVIAIENVRLFDELRRRTDDLGEALQQQTATADVLKVISRSAFDLKTVLDALLTSACHLCNADIGTIRYRDDGDFRLAATFGCPPEWIDKFSTYSTKADRGTVFGRTIIDGHTIHIPDVLADPDFKRFEAQKLMGFRAALGVPLTREGQVFGVINLFRFTVSSFEDKQIELVQTFADQAVIAIENVRLFNEVKARTEELSEALQQQTATADVLKLISRSAFDLQAVLNTLTESAARLCNADMGAIALQDEHGFYHATNHNFTIDWIKITDGIRLQPGKGSLIGRTLLASAPVQITDVLSDPDYQFPDMQQAAGYRSLLGVPLMRGGEAIGVLFLGRKTVEPYSDRQIELVSTFADQAVIAIENVRLFDEVQAKTRDLEEALTYQTGSANILKVIASSPTEVGPVLTAIVESACELCGAYDAVLRLKTGDQLELRAHHGTVPADWNLSQINPYWTAGRAALERRPVHVHDMSSSEGDEFPEAQARALEKGHRTILSVPLLQEGDSIGTITLRRLEVNPFSDKQIALLQTFADQAVIAIGNVHLFEEVQAKTRDLSEALEFQTATGDVLNVISRSPNNLQPVMDTIVETAQRLCSSEYALIMQRRDDGFYRIVAHANADQGLLDWLQENPVSAGDGSAVGIVAIEKKTLHLHDALADSRFTDLRRQSVSRARTMLAVPLLHEDEMIGVVFLGRTEVRPFSDRQVELVTSFADQAVIAISNVKLFEEVQQRTRELSKSLDDLRTAQDRLVQTEKLASLGQLTAGIAHEIKNPLNFVNNFAALSAELTEELNEVLKPADIAEKIRAEVDELTGLLKSNLQKVVQHGKRADSIVKNMLLHSREGGGEHRLSDINALVDESLNLAYHGARAERPDFNVTLERDFDPAAGQLDLYPQEVTRVVLNLVSNGFHAVTKRRKEGGEPGFEPTLRASTKTLGDSVEIRIRDNGTGIPPEVREKMFDPFFTTKPAGEGTGLGLSMSHDIIVKQHGGTIEVDTEQGHFTEFRIVLPRTTNFAEKPRG
jgi:GAF domain-containing protein